MQNLEQVLHECFGFDGFREGQKPVIENLISGSSSLAIFPTGSGKSLCYQFVAMQLPSLTLVVSPLLALMKDQLEFLRKHNIPAASLDSTLSFEEYRQVVKDVRNNTLKILMVSVERFKNERFRVLIENTPISLLVVDEAHCISEWGHNFRPDYLKLPKYQADLNIPQALLLTATATPKVMRDMATKFSIPEKSIMQTGFYRRNLHLHILPVSEEEKIQKLSSLIESHRGGSGIVYVTLQNTAERVAKELQCVGIAAKAYHAGMNNDVRKDIQDEFMSGEVPVVVATIAFGMGVDKPDIRFVIHHDLPKSIENYSQEIGRAGRDGHPSDCYVLGNLSTLNTIENFVYGDTPELSGVESVLSLIKNRDESDCLVKIYTLSNVSNIRQLTLKTLLVKLEMASIITPKYSYSDEYKIKLQVDQEFILSKFEGERCDFVLNLFRSVNFRRTWGLVDFDRLYKQHGGERKRAITALEYMRDQDWLELKVSGTIDVYAVNDELLNQSGLSERLMEEFKQHEKSEILRIALLLRFLQSQNCLSHGLSRYFGDKKSPEKCGHCSVCLGEPASFSGERNDDVVDKSRINTISIQLKEHLDSHGILDCSNDLVARFLVGISVPVFTSTKAKSNVEGFGCFENTRYRRVIELLEQA